MSRTGLGLAIVALTALGGGLAVRGQVIARIEGAMKSRGVSWDQRAAGVLAGHWHGVKAPFGTVDDLDVDFVRQSAKLVGVDVDVAALAPMLAAGRSDQEGAGPTRQRSVEIEDLTLHLPGGTVLSGWTGSLRPSLALLGPEGWVRQTQDGVDAHLSFDITHPFGSAKVSVSSDPAHPGVLGLLVQSAWVEHPIVGTRLELGSWQGDVTLSQPLLVTLHQQESTLVAQINHHGTWTLEVSDYSLEQAVGCFGEAVPEGQRGQFAGRLGLSATFDQSTGRWSAHPTAEGLSARGILPDPEGLRRGRFSWAFGGQRRVAGATANPWTPLAQAGWMPSAVLAAEDARFNGHRGFDLQGIQAALDEWSGGETRPRGGSTITQQLAKNLFLDGERSLVRKMRELLLALALEDALSKDELLQTYLNVVQLGPDVVGIHRAADVYFAKRAKGLTPSEAAFIASLLPAPNRGFERAQRGALGTHRVNAILDNMVNLGTLSPEERAQQGRIQVLPSR